MNFLFLSKTQLFSGIKVDEIISALQCLQAYKKEFKCKEIIYREGKAINEIGLVKQGSVNIVEYDYWGNKSIIGNINTGDIFALSYASIPETKLQGDIIANEDCNILFLNIKKILNVCSNNCPHHNKLIHNLFSIAANKTLTIKKRMKHISFKTIRAKLISYLSEQAFENNDSHFTIKFNRQQLSEYLVVDRSALSNELSKMQKDGLIIYEKNKFKLIKIEY
ncbi:MAG: Crp/Fnr family transcriptional regulator [Treponema sp.]|nr:Crp/Fnr family transcriptional regulator [Treponema sp.]